MLFYYQSVGKTPYLPSVPWFPKASPWIWPYHKRHFIKYRLPSPKVHSPWGSRVVLVKGVKESLTWWSSVSECFCITAVLSLMGNKDWASLLFLMHVVFLCLNLVCNEHLFFSSLDKSLPTLFFQSPMIATTAIDVLSQTQSPYFMNENTEGLCINWLTTWGEGCRVG